MYGQTAVPPPYPSEVDNMKLCDSIVEAMNLNDTLPMKQNPTYGSYYNGTSTLCILFPSTRNRSRVPPSKNLTLCRTVLMRTRPRY